MKWVSKDILENAADELTSCILSAATFRVEEEFLVAIYVLDLHHIMATFPSKGPLVVTSRSCKDLLLFALVGVFTFFVQIPFRAKAAPSPLKHLFGSPFVLDAYKLPEIAHLQMGLAIDSCKSQ